MIQYMIIMPAIILKDLDILDKLIEEEFPDYKDAFKDAFSKIIFILVI